MIAVDLDAGLPREKIVARLRQRLQARTVPAASAEATSARRAVVSASARANLPAWSTALVKVPPISRICAFRSRAAKASCSIS